MAQKQKEHRRPPIPGGQPHRDRKNDYRRQPKHPKREANEQGGRSYYLPLSW